MMSKKVSVILIHYNQPQYVKEALDSVFNQSYNNIELIFADDASSNIDLDYLKKYCKDNNKKKYDIIWQINKENLGTVKNVNRAVKKSSGDYILIFAADDKLCSSDVISKFVDSFECKDDDVAMIFGQCFMMDKNLKNIEYKFINSKRGLDFNKLSSFEQFEILCTECFIAMGASMIKSSVLKKVGYFDEKYKYIEDWAIFLLLTNKNYRLIYDNDIDALLHRDGGISHRDMNFEPEPYHIDFELDLFNIMINEVFPKFSDVNFKKKCEILDLYNIRVNNLINYGVDFDKTARSELVKHNLVFFVLRKLAFFDNNYDIYKSCFFERCSKIFVFILGFYTLNSFFEEKFKLVFDGIIYLLILLLVLNSIIFIFYFVNHLLHKISKLLG